MKIAVVTDDGTTISQHFGQARLYAVFTVESGKIMGTEQREKTYPHHFIGDHLAEHGHGQRHGHGPEAHVTHASMAQPIADCKVLIAGGMGMPAFDSLKSFGIEAIVTDVDNIDEAVVLYLEGKLRNLKERLH